VAFGEVLDIHENCDELTSGRDELPRGYPDVHQISERSMDIHRTRCHSLAMLFRLLTLIFVLTGSLFGQTNPDWTKPFPPHRVVGNVYYAGLSLQRRKDSAD
jgi:hypothetical protein